MSGKIGGSDGLVQKWGKALDGIKSEYAARVTAQLLENQAKAVLAETEKLREEALTPGATTVGQLGTFQKFAFPLVRRVYPELIFNYIGATQPMSGPVSQIFYLGHDRAGNDQGTYTQQTVYSKFNLTYRGLSTSGIGSVSGAGGTWNNQNTAGNPLTGNQVTAGAFDLTSVLDATHGSVSTTFGGQVAMWPDSRTIAGWSVSGGESLRISGIPEVTFHIQQQAVVARTRKMRALWTLEASQDLKAYHNLNLEQELTDLLSKEVSLEIDRELIEDIRMIAYGHGDSQTLGGWVRNSLDNANPNNFGSLGVTGPNEINAMTPGAFNYDFNSTLASESLARRRNVIVVDLTTAGESFAPQHVGHRFSNLLAAVNFASQDIYRTTFRGPGTVLVTSPIIATMLESAAKLEGGISREDGPSNMGQSIEYRGKFAGKYDLIVDPMYPEDEILVAYNGSNPMDSGFVYAPYIPLMPLPTITDPETFQPRKGILTRYGKAAVTPENRFYRIVRVVGAGTDWLTHTFAFNDTINGTAAQW